MGLFQSLSGMVDIELVSADITSLLNQISEKGITMDHLKNVDEMTVRTKISRVKFKELSRLAKKRGDKIRVIKKGGIYWHGKQLLYRPILTVGLFLLFLLALLLPSRILLIRVQGNQTIPSKLILEKADDCGISLFASRRKVRSEKVKNALLEKIPELQWAGVNTAGCIATISVTEKTIADSQPKEDDGRISSIVASRDGIILDCTVLRGNALCQVGQVVKAGQILVSGYIDCGIKIRALQAKAEINARTLRNLQVISPVITEKRSVEGKQIKRYSLLFGKKLIKLYKGSGISDTSCVKIYDEIQLTLPGGYPLPVSLIRETITQCAFVADVPGEQCQWLEKEAISYLQSQMVAGSILDQEIQTERIDDIFFLNGQFSCVEMISQVRNEDFYKGDG